MIRRKRTQRAIQIEEVRRAKYLDCRAIHGSDFVVTDVLIRAPFPQSSAELRAAADRALVAEMVASIDEEPKK